MVRCVCCGLDSKANTHGYTFHRLPSDNGLLMERWLQNMSAIESFSRDTPAKTTYLCSSHFDDSCFLRKESGKARLKRNSVPTKFVNHSQYSVCCGCNRQHTSNPRHPFFKFPLLKTELMKKWIVNIGRGDNWKPDETSMLCFRHFKQSCFRQKKNSLRFTLKENSVPTLFHKNKSTTSEENEPLEEKQLSFTDSTLEDKENNQAYEIKSSTAVEVRTPPTPASKRRAVDHDHNYVCTPTTIRRKYFECQTKIEEQRSLIRSQTRRIVSLTRKAASLKELIDELKKTQLVPDSCMSCLESIEDNGVRELWERLLKNSEGTITREQYPPALRKFALTLNFYSPKAYEYVREKLNYALPSVRTLRKWYSTIDGEAGFTSESFDALKLKVEESKLRNEIVQCSLILDEMGLKKGTQITSDGKVYGHIDFGAELDIGDDSVEAKNALVMMVVALNNSWKLPISYFLIDGMKSEMSVELIETALIKLHEVGVQVVSLTFDGTQEHKRTAQLLGADFRSDTFIPHFCHPITNHKIYVIFDACHMLKLIRNTLGNKQVLIDGKDRKIEWRFIKSLATLQENEGLRLGNKLRLRHVNFLKMQMKVSLAAQTLSKSVADALEYCMSVLNLADFQECEATIEFIRAIDLMFDFLNSRNPYGKFSKAPLSKKNEHIWRPKIMELMEYISELKTSDNVPIFKSRRSMGFVGMFSACKSIIDLYDEHVKPDSSQLRYLLTYKLSQDHIELFFCAIRARGGWCSNPTCMHFVSSYKKLVVVSLTFDGTQEHKRTAQLLGADFRSDTFIPHFCHPITNHKIYVIFDACHMLKLIRNTLGNKQVLIDGKDRKIEWRFIKSLATLQENEGLRLGNKLRLRHVNFLKMQMKVSLAAQTLSKSVADALEYCMSVLNLADFQECEATIEFIRAIDLMFDFLNSRNPYGKFSKAPLSKKNEHIWRPKIMELMEYISELKTSDNVPIFKSRRSMGFVGMFSACKSIIDLYDEHVKPDSSQLRYLLTYKLSQDHIELFFCAIRARGGWCSNPTCMHFVSSYKKLLLHNEIKACQNGNERQLDETSILNVTSGNKKAYLDRYDPGVYDKFANARVAEKYGLQIADNDDDSVIEFPQILLPEIASFSNSAVAYICGFVVRKVWNKVSCETCRSSLIRQNIEVFPTVASAEDSRQYISYLTALKLINFKNNGGLVFPSKSAYELGIKCEKTFRYAVDSNHGNVPTEPQFPAILMSQIVSDVLYNSYSSNDRLFSELDDHHFDQEFDDLSGHICTIVKEFSKQYIKLRMYALVKNISLKQVGENLRHYTNRTLVWRNQ